MPAKVEYVEKCRCPPRIVRTSVPRTTSASRCWSASSITSAAGSIGVGTGGWCIARIVPDGAGVASTSASHRSCSSLSSPWW